MLEFSVVIPVYKADSVLEELYKRLVETLESMAFSFEIIFVEDCGGDNSWLIIENISKKDPRVRGIKLSRNFGQHAATICGISKSIGNWIVTLDDDLEQKPEDVPELYNKARKGYVLVYGTYSQRTHSLWRNLTSNIARYMFRLAIPSLNHEYTSFRIIKGNIAKKLCDFDSPYPFVDGYLSWLTNNYSTVVVEHQVRGHAPSNYNFRKLLTHTMNIFVTFSDLPLKLATWVGFGSFLIGMLWLTGILLTRILGGITVSGFASLMAGVILFGGIQLLILGIFGEYLSRINFKSSKKPLFLVGVDTGSREIKEHEENNNLRIS